MKNESYIIMFNMKELGKEKMNPVILQYVKSWFASSKDDVIYLVGLQRSHFLIAPRR